MVWYALGISVQGYLLAAGEFGVEKGFVVGICLYPIESLEYCFETIVQCPLRKRKSSSSDMMFDCILCRPIACGTALCINNNCRRCGLISASLIMN